MSEMREFFKWVSSYDAPPWAVISAAFGGLLLALLVITAIGVLLDPVSGVLLLSSLTIAPLLIAYWMRDK
jgi:hypothetical protein